ncbi:hypothetical protein B0H13DRAFT_2493334 [Mycena leptocephala]|nr:hypothetical protein B0H13DRAFT_2493334 [Mycena leptocephala]
MPKTLSTHATRNPTRAVQQPRQRTKSTASKNTNTLAASNRGAKKRALEDDIEEFYVDFQDKVAALAIKHDRKQQYIKKRLSNSAQFKQRRAGNIRNAIMHDMSKKAKEAGDDGALPTICDNLSKEEYLEIKESLTAAEHTRLMKQLAEHQVYKHRGIRATNKSLAMDAMQTANRVGEVLEDLFERTGVRAFAIFSRGSPDDSAAPHISFVDFVLKFEHWSCTEDTEVKDSDNVQSVRKQIVLLILEGLRKIKNKKKIDMDYVNYKVDIRHKHGVELAGWPEEIPFVHPVKLSAEQARDICDDLKSGTIRWVSLMPTQRKELAKEIEGLLAEGPLKLHKERSDKGKRWKGVDSDSESEEEEGDRDESNKDGDSEDEDQEGEEEEDTRPARKSTTATKTASRKSAPTATPAAARKSAPTAAAVARTPTEPDATPARTPLAPVSAAPVTSLVLPAPCAADPALGQPPSVARTPFAAGTILNPETTAASANAGGTSPGADDLYNFDYTTLDFTPSGLAHGFTSGGLTGANNAPQFPQLINADLGGFPQSYGMPPLPSAGFGDIHQPYRMPPLPDSFLNGGACGGLHATQLYHMPPLPDAGLQHLGVNGAQDAAQDIADDLRTAVSAAFANTSDPGPAGAGLADATNTTASKKAKRKRSAKGEDDTPPPKNAPRTGKTPPALMRRVAASGTFLQFFPEFTAIFEAGTGDFGAGGGGFDGTDGKLWRARAETSPPIFDGSDDAFDRGARARRPPLKHPFLVVFYRPLTRGN